MCTNVQIKKKLFPKSLCSLSACPFVLGADVWLQICGEGTVSRPVGFSLLIPPSRIHTRGKFTLTRCDANWEGIWEEKYRVKALSFVPSGNPESHHSIMHRVPTLIRAVFQFWFMPHLHSAPITATPFSPVWVHVIQNNNTGIITNAGINLFSLSSKIQLVYLNTCITQISQALVCITGPFFPTILTDKLCNG